MQKDRNHYRVLSGRNNPHFCSLSLPRYLRISHQGGKLHTPLASNFYFGHCQFKFHNVTMVIYQSHLQDKAQTSFQYDLLPSSCGSITALHYSSPRATAKFQTPQRCPHLKSCSHTILADSPIMA